MNPNTILEYYMRVRIYYIITSWRIRSYIKNTRSSLSMRVRKFLSNTIYRIQSLRQLSNDYLMRGMKSIRDIWFIISYITASITYNRNIMEIHESFGCYSNFYEEEIDNESEEYDDEEEIDNEIEEEDEEESVDDEEYNNISCTSFDTIDFSDTEYSTEDSNEEQLVSNNDSTTISTTDSTTVSNKKRKFSQVYM